MEKKNFRCFFVLYILLQSVFSIKNFNCPIGSLFIFKGMFFQPKNVPIEKMKINSDNEIINDNNNNNENNDIIKEEENEINGDQTKMKIIMKNKVISEEKKRYFIYVDPLDDFGAATVARKKCAEAG